MNATPQLSDRRRLTILAICRMSLLRAARHLRDGAAAPQPAA